jgi:hypothetical protein
MLCLQRREDFQRDMGCAIKIYKIHSKNNAKIAECNYLLGKVACLEGRASEGVELMESSSVLFLKMENYVESLNVSFELLHFLEGDEGKYEVILSPFRSRSSASWRYASDISPCGRFSASSRCCWTVNCTVTRR